MNAHSILVEFRLRGIELRAEGDKLIAKPLSAVTPELRESVRQHKAEILSVLVSKPPTAPPLPARFTRFWKPAGATAWRCGSTKKTAIWWWVKPARGPMSRLNPGPSYWVKSKRIFKASRGWSRRDGSSRLTFQRRALHEMRFCWHSNHLGHR
jgi:hypothetical protein